MISLSKLVLLVGLCLAVWYGFKLIGRVQEIREVEARRRRQAEQTGHVAPGARNEIEDTVKCRACGAYVPVRGAGACGRSDCPHR